MSKKQSNPKPDFKKPPAPPVPPAPKLKTLAQHNAARIAEHTEHRAPGKAGKPNGIACPICKAELHDTNPGVILMSIPPQKDIHCPACDWTGHRIC